MNRQLLKAAIAREGLTAEVVAERIGITPMAFSNKVQSKTDFKLSEIQAMIDILCLDKSEVLNIFFGD